MTLLYDHETITQLIPQRWPMLEVDAFYGMDEGVAVAGLTVREDNILCEGDHLSEEGLTEHMAQSAAARAGYMALQAGEPIRLGYIGSVNQIEYVRLPKVDEEIRTRVRLVEEVMNIALLEIESHIGEERIASCRMKIFLEQ